MGDFTEEDLAPLRELLLRRCGFHFGSDRMRTLREGVAQRMALRGVFCVQAYRDLLAGDPVEFQQFVELLTVNETYFFREPDHLRLVAEKIAPEILARPGRALPVRIVSVGCSTGEEPYSLAILLQERFGDRSAELFSIAGGDIDTTVLDAARRGIYGPESFRGMDERLRVRYFAPSAGGRHQLGEIRHRVRFETFNLLSNAWPVAFGEPDILFYRNVSIYFSREMQREIFARLAARLARGGYLFVGASETMHHDIGILPLTERDRLFFFRKGTAAELLGDRRTSRRPPSAGSAFLDPSANPTAAVAPRPAGREAATGEREVRDLFDDALDLARHDREEEALALLDRLLERDPSFIKAHSLKAGILLGSSRHREAAAACHAALRLDPLCLEACLMLGLIARHEGNDDEARRRFREAVYLNPACWLGHFHLASIALAEGDRKRARCGFEAALRTLEQGAHGKEFFPLSFNAGEFITICRHKLSLLRETS